MKTRILTSISLLALLLVSTSILADGRPTGIRIGRLVSGGGTNVELDVTITDTNFVYDSFYTQIWMGPALNTGPEPIQVTGNGGALPYAIDWGDGEVRGDVTLLGPSTGPWTGTFAHSYTAPGTYTVTVGDAYQGKVELKGGVPFTGNAISASTRYVAYPQGPFSTFGSTNTWTVSLYQLVAMTANATVTTGTGIPALNIYGLLAMSLVLVGTGVLVFRRPRRTAV